MSDDIAVWLETRGESVDTAMRRAIADPSVVVISMVTEQHHPAWHLFCPRVTRRLDHIQQLHQADFRIGIVYMTLVLDIHGDLLRVEEDVIAPPVLG